MIRALGLCFLAGVTAGTVGCNSDAPTGGESGTTSGGATTGGGPVNKQAPAFPAGSGQKEGAAAAAYPSGPYGYGIGSVIENYAFIGFQDHVSTPGSLQEVTLADFYNPNGDDTSPAKDIATDSRYFPAGSIYGAGTLKPRVLLIDIASVWCGPCNEEAGLELPNLYKAYKPCGGEFLLQLADGPTPGISAVQQDLINWTTKYSVSYPGTIDPASKLWALSAADAFPENMMIDTRTMKVVQVVAGVPPKAFWQQYESLLGANPTHQAGGVPAPASCIGSNNLPF